MPDETPPRPSDSPDDADTNAAPDAELDAVLSEAKTLAGHLSEQIGESPSNPAATSPSERTEPSDSCSSTEQIELELAELERLVDVAGAEVTEASDLDTQPAEPYNVPSFMSEFTEPSAESDAEPSSDDMMTALDEALCAANAAPELRAASLPDPSLGVVGTDMFNTDQQLQMPIDVPDMRARGPAGKVLAFVLMVAGYLLGRLWESLSPAVYVVCDRVVSVLEIVDRPVSRLNDSVRRAAGLMALATLGTSLLVFAYSML